MFQICLDRFVLEAEKLIDTFALFTQQQPSLWVDCDLCWSWAWTAV